MNEEQLEQLKYKLNEAREQIAAGAAPMADMNLLMSIMYIDHCISGEANVD